MKIAFIGHRKINITNTLKDNLYAAIEKILYDFPDAEFLFGSNSEFDFLCLQTINNLRLRFPYLKRIYVRAKMENLNESYEKYLHSIYDDTFFPNEIKNQVTREEKEAYHLSHIEHVVNLIGVDHVGVATDDMDFCKDADYKYGEVQIYPYKEIASNLRRVLGKRYENFEVAKIMYGNMKDRYDRINNRLMKGRNM